MSFSQADADKLTFAKYAATFPGALGKRGTMELAGLLAARSTPEIREMERHIEVCAALLASAADAR